MAASFAADAAPFFVDDDEETFSLLLAGETGLDARLEALAARLRQDPLDSAPWQRWTDQCRHDLGMSMPVVTSWTAQAPPTLPKPPAIFDTPAAQTHLQSIQAILNVAESTAVQLTSSCLRSMEKGGNLESIFGSQALVEKVVDHAYRQRTIRLSVLAEGLRAEKDESHAHQATMARLLPTVNQMAAAPDGISQRGIFQLFLLSACQPHVDLALAQLLPAKDLWVHQPRATARPPATRELEWKALIHRIKARHAQFILDARREGLEGLIVLLYDRMEVTRADYALLLVALGAHDFFAGWASQPRLEKLAGMLCIEACAIWKTTSTVNWIDEHALFHNAASNSELHALQHHVESLVLPGNSMVAQPQGLVALSFGLLLHLANYPEGSKLAELAADNCDAVGYLCDAISELVEPPTTENKVVDLEWFEKSEKGQASRLSQDDSVETELTASCLLYASIGREVVNALVSSFQNSLLAPQRSSFPENLNIMANLIKAVHCNSATLSLPFWKEWDTFAASDQSQASTKTPLHHLCLVMELSHNLVKKWVTKDIMSRPGDFLRAVAPFLKITSALVFSADMVEAVVNTFFPPKFLRMCLVACQSTMDPVTMETYRPDVLLAIQQLVQLGTSGKCRMLLRQSLEDESMAAGMSVSVGPQFLFRIAAASGPQELRAVAMIVAGLVPGAPAHWYLQATFALNTIHLETKGGILRRERSATEALVHLTYTLVSHVNTILLAQGIEEDIIVAALTALGSNLVAVGDVLITSTSSLSSQLFDGYPLPRKVAAQILATLGNVLIVLRPVASFHASANVRAVAGDISSALLRGLVETTGVGSSAMFFATLPAALNLSFAMKEALRDLDIAQAMRSSDHPWGMSLGSSSTNSSDNASRILASRIHEMESSPMDLSAVEADGRLYGDSVEAILQASSSALRLLLVAFDQINDIEDEGSSIASSNLLLCRASAPLSIRRSRDLSAAWSSSGLSYFDLLLRQLHLDVPGSISLPSSVMLESCVIEFSPAIGLKIAESSLFATMLGETFDKLTDSQQSAPERKLVGARLRVLSSYLTSKMFSSKDMRDEVKNWTSLVDCVSGFGIRGNALQEDEVLLCLTCLRLLLILRKEQIKRGQESSFTADRSVLSAIASFALQDFYNSSIFLESLTTESVVHRSERTHLVSAALEFLTLEMHMATTESLKANAPIFSALDSALEDESRLFAWTEQSLAVTSLSPFITQLLAFCKHAGELPNFSPSAILGLVNLFGVENSNTSSESLAAWLDSLQDSNCASTAFSEALHRLRVVYVFLKREMTRVLAAKNFILLVSLSRRVDAAPSFLLATTDDRFSRAMAVQVADCLDQNMGNLDMSDCPSSSYTLVDTMSTIFDGFSSLLMELTTPGNQSGTNPSWESDSLLKVLQVGSRNAAKILELPGLRKQHCFVVQKLLATATRLLKVASMFEDSPPGVQPPTRMIQDVQIELASTACKVLRRLEILPVVKDEEALKTFSKCFCTCVAFLSHVCEIAKTSFERRSFFSRFFRVLLDSNVTASLVHSVSDQERRQRIGNEGVLSVFQFFQFVSTLESTQVLGTLLDAGIHKALIANFHSKQDPGVIAGVAMRGYVSLRRNPVQASRSIGTPSSLQIGLDDSSHEIQISGTRFIASALRSIAVSNLSMDSSSKGLGSVALDYLDICGPHFLHCLTQMSQVSFNSDVASLTIRSVREATSILSLVAELCRRHLIDHFKRRLPELYKAFCEAAMSVSRSMCSLLGASGSSRELFRAMADDDVTQNGSGNTLGISPLSEFLSRGISNSRHEAIRFSHFVSRCSAAVTEKEHEEQANFVSIWEPKERRLSLDDPRSESALERKCKISVTSDFAFSLEDEAGRCLFHALDVIWKTHPISSSFVMFDDVQLPQFDPVNHAAVGTVIRFHDQDEHGTRSTLHGEVESIDTLRRSWTVKLLDQTSATGVISVPMTSIIGIEDITQRRRALKFSAAPENSAELDELGSSLSTGHLMAALRWCHEFSFEVGHRSSTARLAEVLTVLLGSEISLARETMQKSRINPEITSILSVQLLDLYGEDAELCIELDPDATDSLRREGRLRHLLAVPTWDAIRDQIRIELQGAKDDIGTRRATKRSRSMEGDSWFGSYRRSPSKRSPFRQISV